MSKPLFEPEGCPTCHFLGSYDPNEGIRHLPHRPADLYYCTGGRAGGSLIARFSDEPSDYESSPFGSFITGNNVWSPYLNEVFRRAFRENLLTPAAFTARNDALARLTEQRITLAEWQDAIERRRS